MLDNMLTGVGKPLGAAVVWKRESGPSYLYLFDATIASLWTPPADVVSEDASDAYEIVDLGGALGKGLRKKTANTATKRAFFNSYNTFAEPTLTRFYFYFTTLASFHTAFSVTVINGLNSGWSATGLQRDAATGKARHMWRKLNTNAGSIINNGASRVDILDYAYMESVALSTQYIAECRVDTVTNKQRMRVSPDGGATRRYTVFVDQTGGQSRVAFIDWIWQTPNILLKRVEVTAL